MTDDVLRFAYLSIILMFAVSALVARRAAMGTLVRSLLAWLLIAAVLSAVVLYRDAIADGALRIAVAVGLASPKAPDTPRSPRWNGPMTEGPKLR